MPTITICSSANFYRQVVDIEKELSTMGFEVIIPYTAGIMKASGDFDVSHYKTWFGDTNDYHKKTDLMLKHFDKIAEGDAILVINNEKHGVANYIGGNVLMEMAIALYLKKPIFLFNEVPSESSFLEEIIGMFPIVLHGNIEAIAEEYKKLTPPQPVA
jgi:hypothetical protein